jgi:hypothetical protein
VTELLLANAGLAARGFTVAGAGLVLNAAEAERVRDLDARFSPLVASFRKGNEEHVTGNSA